MSKIESREMMSDKQDKRYIEVTDCRVCKYGERIGGEFIPSKFVCKHTEGEWREIEIPRRHGTFIDPDCELPRPEEAPDTEADGVVFCGRCGHKKGEG